MENFQTPDANILFGQFLIEKKKLKKEVLEVALDRQKREDSDVIRRSHRKLGQILTEDFHVFINRVELQHYLNDFVEYKKEVENMLSDARIYGKKQ
jgi:ubiquinone biosynthesis protein UbiJ